MDQKRGVVGRRERGSSDERIVAVESWKGKGLYVQRSWGREVKKKERTARTDADLMRGREEEVKKEACVSKKFWWVQRFCGWWFYGDPATSISQTSPATGSHRPLQAKLSMKDQPQ